MDPSQTVAHGWNQGGTVRAEESAHELDVTGVVRSLLPPT
jgi:hypothetical protein